MTANGNEFIPDTTTRATHAAAILAALQDGPKTTTALRLSTGAMSPAARILDLRKAGWPIVTMRRGLQASYMLQGSEA